MKIENTLHSEPQAMKIIVAAEAGNGKTSLAKTIEPRLKEKVLVISAEAGLLSLRGSSVDFVELQKRYDEEKKKYVEVPKTERIQRLGEIFKYLNTAEAQAKYKWIFVDSLTEINQNVEDVLDADPEFQGAKNTIKKFGELSKRMMSLCKAFRDLPHYNVVMSALVKEKTDSDGKPQLLISMTGSFAEKLPALFDLVMYLGVLPEKGEDGRNVRKLLTSKTDRLVFPKDRSGRLGVLEEPDLGLIAEKLRAAPVVADASAQAKDAARELKVSQTQQTKQEGVSR